MNVTVLRGAEQRDKCCIAASQVTTLRVRLGFWFVVRVFGRPAERTMGHGNVLKVAGDLLHIAEKSAFEMLQTESVYRRGGCTHRAVLDW